MGGNGSKKKKAQKKEASPVNKHDTVVTERGTVLQGMDHEVFMKLQQKEDPQYVAAIEKWIVDVVGHPLSHKSDLYQSLRNGAVLCEVVNIIRPGIIKRYNPNPKHRLHEVENIQLYLIATRELSVDSSSGFIPSDLNERRDMAQVMQNVCALSRRAHQLGFQHPPVKNIPPPKMVPLVDSPQSPPLSEGTPLVKKTPSDTSNTCCLLM
ncbi:hypothetical protein Pelo_4740 [Pelomyxa schiedti]|nr:hypothetical protein Pelo_4740 [Pelomyxa schiedti]